MGSRSTARGAATAHAAAARLAFILVLGFGLALTPAHPLRAQAVEREVLLRFLPPPGNVGGYRVRLTNELTSLATTLDVGFVAPDSDGIGRIPVLLDAAAYLAALTAYNASGESAPSNQIRIAGLCDAAQCDDGNSCTADACDASGCLQTPIPDGSSCDDGSVATQGDRCVAGVCIGVVAAVSVDAVIPNSVRAGTTDLQIQGSGFANGTTLRFENGEGTAPRVRSLSLVNSSSLLARIDVRAKRPARTRYFDVVVALADGTSARLVRGLRIDP